MRLHLTFIALANIAHGIVMPDGNTGKLPTLGWNSWNAYGCEIQEDYFLASAEALVNTGLQAAGYTYVNIDDCWSVKTGRSATGHILPNTTRFPDGIDGLASKVHAMNLSIGIYSTAGTRTCAGYPASLGYEDIDAADFAAWGIDYLKYDNCNVPANWTDEYVFCNPDSVAHTSNGTCTLELDPDLAPPGYDWSKSNSSIRFKRMRDALAHQDREILLSLCIWGDADVYSWGNDTGVNWRMSNDIGPSWAAITRILNDNSFRLNSVDFWGHNDADMLEVGNGDLSTYETRTHFAFWAAMKSPLLIGTDLTTLSADAIALLKNEYLLAFNQDPTYGSPATPYKWGTNPDWTWNSTYPAEYWSGVAEEGTLVLMLNSMDHWAVKTAMWDEIPSLESCNSYHVTDVWTGENLGCLRGYSANISSHDTSVILVGDKC
ncbi:Alpha-galactosidase [Pleurostoma richardsiae]|uniref:Alpha-galactosidase n=1 Tax=Pleurostoma richardsiae TaxID=41990 RepID=A0AA38RUJ2_9PEZI|nr:Alpha-galactosidase [Pleurostoma richardsiae]